ncbi:MAG TPA: HTH-type transcriptional activator IlvY [Actinomycetota bacterium]|jgi:LysR family positive regulator for ilvC|nr:HTH-type transcriptional activator IlvY [Actinomycetota bacterium]
MPSHQVLGLFLHLSRSLRFARTAEECHISPAALSRAIQRLEKEIGAALFVRDKRNVELTDAGRRLQTYAGDVLSGWDRLERQLHADELEGELKVFCTVTAAQSFLPEILGRFREANPVVHIRLDTGYMADALSTLQAGMDMAVTGIPDRVPTSIAAQTLFVTPLVFVAPTAPGEISRMVEQRTVSWADVPLVVPPFGVIRDTVDKWFRESGEHPVIYSEVPSHEAILSLVAMGCGVGVVPRVVLEGSPLRDQLREMRSRRPMGDLRAAACVLKRRLREPLIAALWDALRSPA